MSVEYFGTGKNTTKVTIIEPENNDNYVDNMYYILISLFFQ